MKFISFDKTIHGRKRHPATYVRKKFCVNKEVRSAELKMTALGVYIPYINGVRIDGQILLPGYTDYKYRVQYQTWNITAMLQSGDNVLAAVVGDGWYRGSVGIGSKINCYGTKTMLGAFLEITYTDGSRDVIEPDMTWLITQNGALRENDLKTREVYHAEKEMSGWKQPYFDDSGWINAVPAAYQGNVIPQEGEPVLEHEQFSPKVLHTPDGCTVLDFGQNMAG